MKSRLIPLILAITTCAGIHASSFAQERPVWVYFTDKGPAMLAKATAVSCGISDEAVARRMRSLGKSEVVDFCDLPVNQEYIDKVVRCGAKIRTVSRWLNAVSIAIAPDQLSTLRTLQFVASITPVAYRRAQPLHIEPAPEKSSSVLSHQLDYGNSTDQVEVINVPRVHEVWVDGTGMITGELDNGFRWREHEALKNLHVFAEYDFIQKDSITENQNGDISGQDEHGTLTLSTFAGFMPGKLIGPAFRSSFYLAKTEDNRSETHAEEDNWVQVLNGWRRRASPSSTARSDITPSTTAPDIRGQTGI